jgi:hypothetical protein
MSYSDVRRTAVTKITLIRRYKEAVGCERCGEKRLPALDLHHREPEQKHDNLTRNGHTGGDRWKNLSFGDLVREIGMCEVVCSNCHRVQRYTDEGWAKITPDTRERRNKFRSVLESIVVEAEMTGMPYRGVG